MAEADATLDPEVDTAVPASEGDQSAPDDPEAATAPAGPIAPTLRILDTRVLRGPNVWVRRPVIRLTVDLGVLEDYPSNTIPGFNEALMAILPTMEDHACSLGRRGGFFERLRDGTWMGHVAEHIALELQCLAGTDVRIGKTRSTGERGRYDVIFEYREETVGLEAGRIAVALVDHLVAPDDPEAELDLPRALERLIRIAERSAFGPSTQAIIDEAVSRDIPWIRLDRHSLVQLGQGRHQQRIRATMTSMTSAIAVDIASDKALTNQLLASAGLPVPRSETVDEAEDAVRAAVRIGFPVVVKPLDGNHGRGVCLDLRSEDDVRKAFPIALRESRGGDVVVETYVTGADHRVLVIGGRMVAVAERVPAGVTGDGEHTITQLVDIANADPRRGLGHEKVLTRISVDEAAIALVAKQGWTMDEVPPEGARVQLALTGNMSTGGTAIDRTLDAHPDNVEIAETAARTVGLDIAGIDFIVPDMGVPVREQGGAIVEVNAAPGFRMHTNPTEGEPQYVAKPVIDLLFPPGTPARIPIIGVTGTNGKTTTVRMIAHVLKLMGRRVGMTSTDGIVIDGRLTRKGDMSGPRSARTVLQNPTVDTAVFEVARGGILREGLGYDRNDIAVVTNISADHLGLGGVDTLQGLAAVKGVLVDAVPRDGAAVLNADDPLVARMARRCDGRVIYFTMQTRKGEEGFDRVDGHCGRGGAAMVVLESPEGELLALRQGSRTMPLIHSHLIPATLDGRARMNVANALAAAAAAWAAGAHLHDIRQGLRTFTTSYFQAPGRLNELDVAGFKVVIDYSHNVDGMRRLAEFVRLTMTGHGRRRGRTGRAPEPGTEEGAWRGRSIGIIGIPGDRRDEDMREYGAIAATAFDEILVREDVNLRGRRPGETAGIVLEGVRAARTAGARCQRAEAVLQELQAAERGLRRAQPGDLVVVCADDSAAVYRAAMAYDRGPGVAITAPGELTVPEG
ncbi:MAG: cyanophycin synthetase [Candidatus Limnocylindrales bacterium]